MPETANTDVEEISDQSNGSDSSSDEQDLESMDEEALRAEVLKEREAKAKLTEHLRAKDAKRKSIEEAIKSSQGEPKEDQQPIAIAQEEVKRLVQQEHREQRIAEYSEGSTDWLKSQPWAADVIKSDKLYGDFAKELKHLTETKGVNSQSDFRKLMKLAIATTTGKADALLDESADSEIISDKQQSGGYRPSSVSQTVSYAGFSDKDRELIERLNAKRVARGDKPLNPRDILKK